MIMNTTAFTLENCQRLVAEMIVLAVDDYRGLVQRGRRVRRGRQRELRVKELERFFAQDGPLDDWILLSGIGISGAQIRARLLGQNGQQRTRRCKGD